MFAHELPYVALRMFNVYGPGQLLGNLRQGMVHIYLRQGLETGGILLKGGLDRFRDFVFISDVREARYQALVRDVQNARINVGTGTRCTVRDLLQAIASQLPGVTWHVEGSTPSDQDGIYADPTLNA